MNRLQHASSLYLRQHAANPVHWQPWDAQALAQAAEQDRPILLSIGYSACHWCHVMAHESFESEAVARHMNDAYVCIKVDREERPDLDKTYQLTHQLMNRQGGGWPLTVFLDPHTLQPYFSGTYFPPTPRHGLPAFPDVLDQLAAAYHDKRDAIREQGQALSDWFARVEPRPDPDGVPADLLPRCLAAIEANFDAAHGGWGAAPKFPHPVTAHAMLGHGDARQRDQAHATLTAMAASGLYDQVDGGFFRYSVDERWCIPHFEKMLYDNALLLSLYASGWQDRPEPLYRRALAGTIAWLDATMRDSSGMYYASLDADSADGEGSYYVYSEAELGWAADGDLAGIKRAFGLQGKPNFEGRWHLQAAREQDDEDLHGSWVGALRRQRASRPAPGRDDKLIAGWNALLALGLLDAGECCQDYGWTERGIGILDAIHDGHWMDGRLHSVRYADRVNDRGFADDYAFTLAAVLKRLQSDWSDRALRWALDLADTLLAQFGSPGGALYLGEDVDDAPVRQIALSDDALPSANAVAALALADLTELTGEPRYWEAAQKIVAAAAAAMRAAPQAHLGLLVAEARLRAGRPTVVVFDGARSQWTAPGANLYVIPPDAAPLPDGLERRRANRPTAYVCQGHSCLPPVHDGTALRQALAGTA